MPVALMWTLGSFALILVLARIKVPLAAAILTGAVVLAGSFCWRRPPEIPAVIGRAIIDPKTVALMVIVGTLLTLSEMMRTTGQLQRIVGLARAFLRRPAVAMASMPMLIGLIPMPGGALFSASMVETAAGETRVSGGRLSAINYWFRHVWEFWWPLYPAVLVATELAKMDMAGFALFQSPLTIFMAAAGLLLFRKTHADLHTTAAAAEKGTGRKLLGATSSIWMIVLIYAAASLAVQSLLAKPSGEAMAALYKYGPVWLALVVSLLWTARINRLDGRSLARSLARRPAAAMVVLVMAVMVFQYTLKAVGAPDRIAEELKGMHVPMILVLASLPFIAGLVTGLGVGFVGASFGIVLPLAQTATNYAPLPPYVMLAFACGHMGMMLSPMHVCHVASNRYFGTGFGPVYRLILPAVAITLALAAGYFLLLRAIVH